MTIIGIGIDIVEIIRIKKIVKKSGNTLAIKILNKNEFQQYLKNKKPIHFLAKRFAAKEAIVKSFGIGMRCGLSFNQLEIYNNNLGKPKIFLSKKIKKITKNIGIKTFHLTISDEKKYACAVAIAEN
ncbi:holo-ACP synthase [Candidatus Purcelliella pentastirinorum]|uniref:Holo-[acyl-carrier-protein] synthase n=1 Tax=Candidatus Purcelliella pentastirinorum TaxID=472834 RepID=A0AAX3N8T1_9ENTR|nr:holo-ACP synthase [Candidatus Purcelliella pentastirinorum]WDI78419.1 holo-ACP synthase [Candidatus Purcelliella pentastirinorum]WDR80552.1 holo-ACP synthase [Candidatus Purcelliella pentastirinorum]